VKITCEIAILALATVKERRVLTLIQNDDDDNVGDPVIFENITVECSAEDAKLYQVGQLVTITIATKT
jgi:hypothetical protein